MIYQCKFQRKNEPLWKSFLETHFFGKLSRGIFLSPIRNLVILREENEVKFVEEN